MIPLRARWTASALSLLLCSAVPLAAESSPGDAALARFDDLTEVKVVNVEAVVTDRQGVRLFGLSPEEFELRVDGQPVDIEYFTEVRGGVALAREAIASRSPGAVSPVAPGRARGTSYLVFVDDFFTLASHRDRVLRALEGELDYLGESDRMAIVAWDGQGVDLVQSWTGSSRDLTQALRRAEDRPAGGLHRRSEQLAFDSGHGLVGSQSYRAFARGVARRGLDVQQRSYTEMLLAQIDGMVAAANATLRGFAEPEGRKVMLLLSGGWPYAPADYVAGNPLDPVLSSYYPRDSAVFRSLVETANLVGYTLYPVDVPGLQSTAHADVGREFRGARGLTDIDFYRENEIHYTLRYLAQETGGRASINSQRDQPLERVVTDTRSFYWLGFTPDWKEDGADHRIEVRLAQPGLRVRTRSGYTDLTRQERVAMTVESALLFGSPAAENGLEVEIGAPRNAGLRRMEVPLELRLPAELLTLLPQESGYVADLEVLVASMDVDGARSDVSREPFRVELASAPTMGQEIDWHTTLRMRRRDHEVVVAIYDAVSGELWSTTTLVAKPRG